MRHRKARTTAKTTTHQSQNKYSEKEVGIQAWDRSPFFQPSNSHAISAPLPLLRLAYCQERKRKLSKNSERERGRQAQRHGAGELGEDEEGRENGSV